MPAQKIFVGQRAKFFEDRKAAYAEAVRNDTRKDFIANAQREFLNRWGPLLPLDVELDQAVLDAVDDNTVSKEYPVPVEEEMEAEEYKKKKKEYDEYRKKLEERKGQIARRFKSDWEEENTRLTRDPKDPWNLLLLRLNGTLESKKPRLEPAVNFWYRDNKQLVREAVEKEQEGKKKKNTDTPNLYMSKARRMFVELDDEVQKEYKERAEAEHKETLKEWDALLTGPPSTDPADRQRCINRLVRFVKPILDGIAERTGFVVSLIAGGPEPQDGGRLNCVSVHSGTTTGDVKMDWARSELGTWKKVIFPSLATFCRKVYSVEECRSRALPMDCDTEEDEAAKTQDDSLHAVGANLEEVSEQGVEVYSGIRNGKAQAEKTDKAIPTAPNKDSDATPTASTSTPKVQEPAHTESEVTQHRSTTKQKPKKPAKRGRKRRASPAPSPSPLRSPSSARSPPPAQSRTRARRAASSPIRHDSPDSPSVATRPHAIRGRARARMMVSSPIRHDSPPNSPQVPAVGAPPFSPPRETSLPPSPLMTPVRGLSPMGTPPRTPIPAPSPRIQPVDVDEEMADDGAAVTDKLQERESGAEAKARRNVRAQKEADSKAVSSARVRGKRQASSEGETNIRRKKARTMGRVEEGSNGGAVTSEGAGGSEEVVELPDSAPEYVVRTYEVITKDTALAVTGFERLVSRWLEFEVKAEYADCPRLKTVGRPEWVGQWFGRHRNPGYAPKHDAFNVLERFWKWWKGIQPEWRQFTERGRPVAEAYDTDRDRSSKEWQHIRRSGPNGLSSVVACLAFVAANVPWMPTKTGREKARKVEVQEALADAVRDVTFVLEVLGSL
ncbi:SERTA domain-containing protein 3 [Marasmius crinis-equi]|uniref:SERTA domain-containing protein 3 n=1 Tax=Marasmius crinis-equi TaxID=585013 RepID=A0ABR3FB70_9AGAR